MREPVTTTKLDGFMRAIGRAAPEGCSIYFVGGVTAILYGWRDATVDIDLKMIPEIDAVYREIPRLKELLSINVELAAPDDFIPELPGWRERSPWIVRHGAVDFYHYDLYAQALAKLERGHEKDLRDAREMAKRGLVERTRLLEMFVRIEDQLYRYPALDPPSFRRAVEHFVNDEG